MEPSKFDRAIRDSLNGRPYEGTQEEKERIWRTVDRQLDKQPSRKGWKVAALILLLLLPSAALWMQNRRQAATIREMNRSFAMIPKPEIIRDTVMLQPQIVTSIRTDTVRKIQIVKDTVIVYRQVEMAAAPPQNSGTETAPFQPAVFNPGNIQESQRAEFLLEPDHLTHRNKKKTGRTFSFRFSLGTGAGDSETPVGIQARL
jgi:hypothetical protein